MLVRELMRWIPSQRRWRKMYRGQQYYISARQLAVTPETKDASRDAANRWWILKRAEVDLASKPVPRSPQPMEDVLAALTGGKPWTNQEEVVRGVIAFLGKLSPSHEAETLADRVNEAAYLESEEGDAGVWEPVVAALGKLLLPKLLERVILHGGSLPDAIREGLPPARAAQIESGAKSIRGESAVPKQQTVKAHVAAWLATQEQNVAIGEMTAARYANVEIHARHFYTFTGPDADVSTIGAASIQGFYRHCKEKMIGKEWSAAYSREMFATVRRFVRWVAEQGTIPLPPNIASRSFKFGATAGVIKTWPVDEVRYVANEASDRLRLYLLLMLNCGMTQKDISDLRDDEIDWPSGRVHRKRSKTRNKESTPEVDYPLWPCTFALLQRFRSCEETALLTETGQRLVRNDRHGGKLRACDLIASNFDHLKKRLGIKRPLKELRKTSASLLENHVVTLPTGETINPYANCVTLFLGHAPASMKDRHYAKPPQALFDAAITWLGQQFGFIGPPVT